MDINTTTYNNYSPGEGYFRGNSVRTSITPARNYGNTSQPHVRVGSTEPWAPQPSPRTVAATDPTPQETTTSNSQPEKQQPAIDNQLTQVELKLLTELKQVDTEVRNHEMAHIAAGGNLITSGANFTYKRGPNGKNYAVAGEVSIDTAAIPGDPQATVQKMKKVKRSAMAPVSPSAQDLKVASKATAMASKALSELTMLRAKRQAATNETQAFGNLKQASNSYTKVNNLPEEDTSTFNLAV